MLLFFLTKYPNAESNTYVFPQSSFDLIDLPYGTVRRRRRICISSYLLHRLEAYLHTHQYQESLRNLTRMYLAAI
jgi:hypothetical protein